MKIKNFFLAGLAVLALSACSDDDKDTVGGGDGLKGYISLKLEAPSMGTRTDAAGGDGTENGLPAESAVSNVLLVLTGPGGFVNQSVTATLPSGSTTTEPVQVSTGTHYVYALVNYTGTAPTAGESIQRVIAAAEAEALQGYKSGSFLMVNEFNGTSVAGTPNGGVAVSVTAANSTAETAAHATVKVDRVAVKIVDKTTTINIADLTTAAGSVLDGVTPIGFAPLNVNKDFNLVQSWTTVGSDFLLSTPLFTADGAANVSSQYHRHIGAYTKLTKTAGNITAIADLTDATDYSDVTYVTENRPAYKPFGTTAFTSGKGETTGVIYRIQAMKGGVAAPTFYKFGNTVTDDWNAIVALNSALQTTPPTAAEIPAVRAQGVQVYENGVMYYTYFIKDKNTSHQLDSKDYYGVFRNSIYSLNVKAIKKIGDDVPGGSINPVDPDPTKPTDPTDPTDPTNPPIDEEDAYIDVALTINPWVLQLHEIEF